LEAAQLAMLLDRIDVKRVLTSTTEAATL